MTSDSRTAPGSEPTSAPRKTRILIVDDSAVCRQILRRAIATEPTFEVAGEASNGRHALDFIAGDVPDAVILDIEMPVMDGLEALVEIRKTHPELPIVMFSSLMKDGASTALETSARAKGASGYVTKPAAGDPNASHVAAGVLIPRVKALVVGSSAAGVSTRARPDAPPAGPAPLERRLPAKPSSAPPPVSRFSSPTEDGASTTSDALDRDTSDCAIRPLPGNPDCQQVATDVLVPEIKALLAGRSAAGVSARERPDAPPARPVPPERRLPEKPSPALPPGSERARRPPSGKPEILVIGSSTGGPKALLDVVSALPGTCPVPVLIVQHMPPVFTLKLAQRLNSHSALTVGEASDGVRLTPGMVWVAPGDYHMEVVRPGLEATLRLHQGPKEQGCRPAVDVMLRSVARAYGKSTLAVILTGMGEDGLIGCRELRAKDAQILVQDEASSVVWGMPGAVARDGLPDAVLPLDAIGAEIVKRLSSPRIHLIDRKTGTEQ